MLRVEHYCIHSVHYIGAFEYLHKAPISFTMSNCLSICLCLSAQLPLDAFPWNLILGTLMKICWKNRNLTKIGKNIGDITWTPKYVLLLPVTLNHHESAVFKWNGIRLFGAPKGYKQYVNLLRCDFIQTDIMLQVVLWWSSNTTHAIKYTNHQNFHCAYGCI
jgi:hypothetical protein